MTDSQPLLDPRSFMPLKTMPLKTLIRSISTLGFVAVVHLSPRSANAQAPESVFGYAFQGLGVGAPIGIGASYLLTRDDSWGAEDWQDLGLGAAIGAISGAAGGLAIGLADMSDGQSGLGAIVLRDTWYGTLLGITVGAIVGGVRLMSSGEGEDVLVSMAWGAVIGAPVGIGVGFAEAAMRDEFGSSKAMVRGYALGTPATLRAATGMRFGLTPLTATIGQRRQFGVMPSVTGTF
jgi:hypothetical protein